MTQIGKYDIIEEIGRGGFGVVYKARDRSLERVVALKVLHSQLTVDPRFVENFHHEARNLARINHPNVVTVFEIGEIDGRLYIAMEYLPGGSLEDRLKREGPLTMDDAMKVIEEAGAGLAAGHKRDIIHRDIKPGNILFNEDGQAVIGDFGVARAVQLSCLGTTTQSSGTVGTPFYRPPELWRGSPPPSPATDMYSLGCVLYEMLTGEVLFSGDTPDQLITKHLLEDAQSLIEARQENIPAAVKLILEKALAKDPQERFQDTISLIKVLVKQQTTPLPEVKVEPKPVERQEPVQYGLIQEKPHARPKPTEPPRVTDKGTTELPTWALWTGVAVLVIFIMVIRMALLARDRRYSTKIPTTDFELGIGSTMVNPGDGAMLVYVPEGEFLMGSEDEDSQEDEKPQHTVYLDAFWIYQHPVTNAEYRACMDAGECRAPPDNIYANIEYEAHPVVSVPWFYADAYCQWAGGRLPTEAEWEKAARGTDGRRYPWGNENPTCSLANFMDCVGGTSPVGSYPAGASPYGVLDMAGNVWEWVADWYDRSYYSHASYDNPIGPPSGDDRVLRGGSWYDRSLTLQISNRSLLPPDIGYSAGGFRCLRSPDS